MNEACLVRFVFGVISFRDLHGVSKGTIYILLDSDL